MKIFWLFTPVVFFVLCGQANAQITINFAIDRVNSAIIQTGTDSRKEISSSDGSTTALTSNGTEADDCDPHGSHGDGRKSAAQASASSSIKTKNDDSLIVDYDSHSYANGGHIRACDGCFNGDVCIGIHGKDSKALAESKAQINITITIKNPLKKFNYNLFTATAPSSEVNGKLDLKVTTPDGIPIAEMKGQPSHFLITEKTPIVFIRGSAATTATDTGGCCSSESRISGTLTASIEPAAELETNYQLEPFIAGGKSTTGYPYVVAIGLADKLQCSGTFVGTHSIVTAAHCIYGQEKAINKKALDVRFGSNFNSPDQKFIVTGVKIPDNLSEGAKFDPKNLEDDIGLIFFDGEPSHKAATFYSGQPPWADILHNKLPVDIVGFGFNIIDGGTTGLGFKREAAINISAVENRKVFFQKQQANTCEGDSGGPLFVEAADGKSLLLAAVTSGGDDICQHGVDTRADAFATWLAANIK